MSNDYQHQTDFLDKYLLYREGLRDNALYWENFSTHGMVTSAHYRATEIGAKILSQGGNAIDAAIAVSLALGIVEPNGSGLGGMTMMMIYSASDQKTIVLEGACPAPLHATPSLVAAAHRMRGYKAVAVPTNPAVLDYGLKNFGRLPLDQITAPVIKLAQDGFPITSLQSKLRHEYRAAICKGNAAHFLLNQENKPPLPGTWIRQPVLSKTIERLSNNGFEDYYHGEIGQTILDDMSRNRGFLSQSDFKNIPFPKIREPLAGKFHSWTILTPPPPCGGITLIEMLNLFEELEPDNFDPNSPQAVVLFASIIQKARRDRRKYRYIPFDLSMWKGPDITGKDYARSAALQLQEELTCGETTHFNVADAEGNIVTVTQSIERSFGAKVAAPELGFLYNGFMKGFKIVNKRHPHYLQPGAVARSNAAPIIVLENGKPKFAIGSTGSERMVSGIFQVLIRLYIGQSPFDAVRAPRLHCDPDGNVFLEAQRFSSEAIENLKRKGFSVNAYNSDWSFSAGGLHLLQTDNNRFHGIAEPRRDGYAMGPDFNSLF